MPENVPMVPENDVHPDEPARIGRRAVLIGLSVTLASGAAGLRAWVTHDSSPANAGRMPDAGPGMPSVAQTPPTAAETSSTGVPTSAATAPATSAETTPGTAPAEPVTANTAASEPAPSEPTSTETPTTQPDETAMSAEPNEADAAQPEFESGQSIGAMTVEFSNYTPDDPPAYPAVTHTVRAGVGDTVKDPAHGGKKVSDVTALLKHGFAWDTRTSQLPGKGLTVIGGHHLTRPIVDPDHPEFDVDLLDIKKIRTREDGGQGDRVTITMTHDLGGQTYVYEAVRPEWMVDIRNQAKVNEVFAPADGKDLVLYACFDDTRYRDVVYYQRVA